MRTDTEVVIEDSRFELLPERAAFWPEHQALICSDLHWGRETFLQKHGMPIPEVSFARETLILKSAIEQKQAKEWWILGDFIHHPKGLDEELIGKIADWMKSLLTTTSLEKIILVPGNHDRSIQSWVTPMPLELQMKGIQHDGFQFLHEPEKRPDPDFYQWYGHLHPSVYLPIMGNEKLPCFWIRKTEAYLPAFSRLAGGMDIRDVKSTDQIMVVVDQQVMEL